MSVLLMRPDVDIDMSDVVVDQSLPAGSLYNTNHLPTPNSLSPEADACSLSEHHADACSYPGHVDDACSLSLDDDTCSLSELDADSAHDSALGDDVVMADTASVFSTALKENEWYSSKKFSADGHNGQGVFDFLNSNSSQYTKSGSQGLYTLTMQTALEPVLSLKDHYAINLSSIKRSSPDPDMPLSLPQALKRRRVVHRFLSLPATEIPPTRPVPNFSNIPPELRDLIYHYALARPKPIRLVKLSLPGICYASKQIQAEATPIFYSINTFSSHIHMPHTYEEALYPSEYHESYKPASLCNSAIKHLAEPKLSGFRARKVSLSVLDKDHAHFASVEFEISKRGVGSMRVHCTEGPEPVADSEKVMCLGMGYV